MRPRMILAFVAAVSLGSISVDAHPSTHLLDAPVLSKMPLADLETQLDLELHRESPFIAPGIALGVGVLLGAALRGRNRDEVADE